MRRPKPNGYRSLHVNMALPSGQLLEVQIRTQAMHLAADRGAAAHPVYKARTLECVGAGPSTDSSMSDLGWRRP